MKKLFTLFIAVMAVVSLSAETYFLKSNWGGAEASWKAMTQDPDDADWFTLENSIFDGKDFAINTVASDEGARVIKAENVIGSINTDAAEMTAGDSVLFIFRPSLVNQYNEKESGLYAMITKKNGYAIRGTWGEQLASWKNLADDGDGGFFVENVLFDGQNVQVINGKEIYVIKPENIKADDYSGQEVTLEAGDIVIFSFNPDTRSAYDETQSGLWAVILKKHGYALQSFFGERELSWKEMTDDGDGKWSIKNSFFDGNDLYINNFASSIGARKIKAENVQGYIDSEFAELSKGDSVIFIYDPETYASMDPSKSGLSAMITNKVGYAIKVGDEWKNLTEDEEDWWSVDGIKFDGKAVQIVHGNEITTIKPENISATIDYDAAELSVGDTVRFIFRPSLVNQYNPKESGLQAMINWKNGYALHHANVWENLTVDAEDADWWTLEDVAFDGEDVAIVSGKEIRQIKVENINAYINLDAAELSAGDTVMFIFRPSLENKYNEKESGLQALINWKNGYALHHANVWKNLVDEDAVDHDWWILEDVAFDGNDVAIVSGKEIRQIKVENINAYINLENAELAAGDSVMFIFRPSLVNRYDEKESGLQALIGFKKGYAIFGEWSKEDKSWKDMTEKEEFFVLENVVFDGNDVKLVNASVIRTIKVENIAVSLLDPTQGGEAKLEKDDVVIFKYTPSKYDKDDATKSGLEAIIVEKNKQQGLFDIDVENNKTMKMMVNGQLFIINNGKVYNVNGVLVK